MALRWYTIVVDCCPPARSLTASCHGSHWFVVGTSLQRLEVSTMADLDANKREQLPSKDFGLPEKARTKEQKKESGNYPMPDKQHARNAKARAAQQQAAGNLTKNERERIDRKADKILDD
jgi:hypothetical protein